MIEEGYYEGELVETVFSAPEGKAPRLCLTFKVGDYRRVVYLFTSDAAWPFTEEKLRRMGFNGDFERPAFTTTKMELECSYEEYEGKKRERWNISGGFRAEPAPADVSKQFSARWNASNAAPPQKPAGKPPSPPPSASKPPSAPPAKSSAAPAKPYGKDDAWDDHCKLNPPDGDAEKWQADIAQVCAKSGKVDETAFGPAEWRLVSGIPF